MCTATLISSIVVYPIARIHLVVLSCLCCRQYLKCGNPSTVSSFNVTDSHRHVHAKLKLSLSEVTLYKYIKLGPLLGPLLFILYTTTLSTLISSLSLNHHLYADDAQLFFSFYPSVFDSGIDRLQHSLQQISLWMTANLLTLSSSKTEFILMGLPQHK